MLYFSLFISADPSDARIPKSFQFMPSIKAVHNLWHRDWFLLARLCKNEQTTHKWKYVTSKILFKET